MNPQEKNRVPHIIFLYWVIKIASTTLGETGADMFSMTFNLGLGFVTSALVLSGLLVGIALLHFFTKISGTLLFWVAFVLTRPFGATFGDVLTKPVAKGGLNLRTVGSSIVFCVLLIFAIARETKLERQRCESENQGSFPISPPCQT